MAFKGGSGWWLKHSGSAKGPQEYWYGEVLNCLWLEQDNVILELPASTAFESWILKLGIVFQTQQLAIPKVVSSVVWKILVRFFLAKKCDPPVFEVSSISTTFLVILPNFLDIFFWFGKTSVMTMATLFRQWDIYRCMPWVESSLTNSNHLPNANAYFHFVDNPVIFLFFQIPKRIEKTFYNI